VTTPDPTAVDQISTFITKRLIEAVDAKPTGKPKDKLIQSFLTLSQVRHHNDRLRAAHDAADWPTLTAMAARWQTHPDWQPHWHPTTTSHTG
jgi:hypothetical protein